jgi:hypothetical protein
MAAAGRRLRALDSIAHGWGDGTITAWAPNQEFEEARMHEGSIAERKAFLTEALAAGLLEDITPTDEPKPKAGAGR